jgi:hypothetical protein
MHLSHPTRQSKLHFVLEFALIAFTPFKKILVFVGAREGKTNYKLFTLLITL